MRCILSFLLLAGSLANADGFSSWREHTSAALIAEEDSVSPGQKVTLGFDVRLQKGWHTYWINPGDSGSVLKLGLKAEVNRRPIDLLTGPIQFPIPERFETGPITSFVYSDRVLFMADVVVPDSVKAGDRMDLTLDAEWLVCQDVCIPAVDTYHLELPVRAKDEVRPSAQAEDFTFWRGRLPRFQKVAANERRGDLDVELTLPIPGDFAGYKYADFFPFRGSQFGHSRPELVREEPGSIDLKLPRRMIGERRVDLKGLLILKSGKDTVGLEWGDPAYGFLASEALPVQPAAGPAADMPLIWILFSAFLGGLLLNLMPCVFPILSIKLFSVVKQGGNNSAAVRAREFFLRRGCGDVVSRGRGHARGTPFRGTLDRVGISAAITRIRLGFSMAFLSAGGAVARLFRDRMAESEFGS